MPEDINNIVSDTASKIQDSNSKIIDDRVRMILDRCGLLNDSTLLNARYHLEKIGYGLLISMTNTSGLKNKYKITIYKIIATDEFTIDNNINITS